MNSSGLILVIIIALWGTLLVPALVRKHDSVTESRSVDRFSYALRILSRRTPYVPGRRDVVVPRRSKEARRPVVSPAPGFVAVLPGAAQAAHSPSRRVAAQRATLAGKRRRTLLGLMLSVALCVGLAVTSGGRWWITVAISAVLSVMYVTHLRTEAQALAAIERRRAQARRKASRRATGERVPAAVRRREPAAAEPLAAQAAVRDSVRDDSWAPMPVTLPTYVTKPVVSRPPVAPPTGVWYDGVLAEQRAARFAAGGDVYDQMSDDEGYLGLAGGLGLGRDDDGQYGMDSLDEILERRRAVND
jgi:hypothetical protein